MERLGYHFCLGGLFPASCASGASSLAVAVIGYEMILTIAENYLF